MQPQTVKFLIFVVFSVLSLVGGYAARKRGWLREEISRPIHFHTVVWVWSAASLMSLWGQALTRQDLWLGAMQMLIVAAAALAAIPLARLLRCSRDQTGVLAIAASVGNLGFTLGGYICYTLVTPGPAALATSVYYVSVMQAVGVLIVYPIARNYGQTAREDQPLWRLIAMNFIDLRSLVLYAAVAGAALAWSGVPRPAFVADWNLLDVLFFLGAFGGYFGIGLRLRLGRSLGDVKVHALLAVLKYAFIPLLTLAMIGLIGLSPLPLGPTAQRVALIEAFMPTAIWTVMIANLFHLDVRLTGSVWLWNTIVFLAVPLPVMLWVMR